MKITKQLIFLFLLFVNLSLYSQSYEKGNDSIKRFDSIIYIDYLKSSTLKVDTLNSKIAEVVLKKYIVKQGFLTYDSLGLPENPTEKDYEKIYDQLVFSLDTIYIVNFKSVVKNFAVVSYYLTPYMASSHCFLPYKALIINSDRGFIVTNEDFIPDNYIIERVENFDNNIVIYCYEYFCYENEIIRYLRIKLDENIKP